MIAFAFAIALFHFAAVAQPAETNVDLRNFHQVNENFYRGAQPTQAGIQQLARLSIKTIINLRSADEDSRAEEWWAQQAGLRYFNFPMKGWGRPVDAQAQAILSVINAPENQPIFVHCMRGKDRTGTIVACYRIAHDHWTDERAIKEARQLGMRWSEFAMKRFIRRFYRRECPTTAGTHGAERLHPPLVKKLLLQ